MTDLVTKYRKLDYPLPDKNLAWRMHEAGVENFGKTGPDVLPLTGPKPDEVLVRVDAIGICFSDVKLITQGSAHARITGRNLAADPVTPGHEVSLTVVRCGDNWKDQYKPGDRFIVQADIYFQGQNLAYGYALAGGMQQYGIVGEPVLNGDEGSYLIPVKPETGYAEAALVEPWTCVVASYRIKPRRAFKPGGNALILCVEAGDYEIDSSVCADGPPTKVIFCGLSLHLESELSRCVSAPERIKMESISSEMLKPLVQERTGGRGFDDIVILGRPTPDLVQSLSEALAKNGVMAIAADKPMHGRVNIDVGRVHYDYIDYVGTASGCISAAYKNNRDSELVAGGAAWFIGAAGPMGQMHVQRAVMMKNPPAKILCTDVDDARLAHLKSGVADKAAERGIEMVYANPSQVDLEKEIAALTGGRGFDDIIVLAPVPALIESAIPYLAKNGLMNIFAGIVKGTVAQIDLSVTYLNGNRFVGSSGSRPQDMIDTLRLTESGELPTRNSLAAIGGIDAMADGVRAVKEARFPGKIVIFPHIRLPLTALPDLAKILPNVYDKLKDRKFWTNQAEEELLRSKLEL